MPPSTRPVTPHSDAANQYAEARSLYPFFFAPQEENGIVGRLKAIG